jgi:hypothetical protein
MAAKDRVISGEDSRLRKSRAGAVRGTRETADADRENLDGTLLSSEERRAALRNEWVQEVLPTPPGITGWHVCWLSTTSSVDPIFRRQRLGYELVKPSEVPGFDSFKTDAGHQYENCVMCNEMILAKIPQERYLDLMAIYHHDMPLEEERMLQEKLVPQDDDAKDRDGNDLVQVEGTGFKNIGQVKRPIFN